MAITGTIAEFMQVTNGDTAQTVRKSKCVPIYYCQNFKIFK